MKLLFSMLLLFAVVFFTPVAAQHTGSTDIRDSVPVSTTTPAQPGDKGSVSTTASRPRVSGHELMRSPKEQMKEQVMKTYVCPDHPHMVADKPGRCVECGKLLNRTSKEKMKMEVMRDYSCSAHPHVASPKRGDCTECGKVLTPGRKKRRPSINAEGSCIKRAKSGACGSCATDRHRSAKEKMKMDVMKLCCCPANRPMRENS